MVNDGVLAVTVRYGRQPLLALLWLILFWAIGVVVFDLAERNSALKPNSPVVLRSLEWTMCGLGRTDNRYMPSAGQTMTGRASAGQSQLSCFLSQPEASSYPEFNPWMYSLDAMLPVMEIGQKQYWRPDPSKPNWDAHPELLLFPVGYRLGLEPSGRGRFLGARQIEIGFCRRKCWRMRKDLVWRRVISSQKWPLRMPLAAYKKTK